MDELYDFFWCVDCTFKDSPEECERFVSEGYVKAEDGTGCGKVENE